jgi:hypothetical protein
MQVAVCYSCDDLKFYSRASGGNTLGAASRPPIVQRKGIDGSYYDPKGLLK